MAGAGETDDEKYQEAKCEMCLHGITNKRSNIGPHTLLQTTGIKKPENGRHRSDSPSCRRLADCTGGEQKRTHHCTNPRINLGACPQRQMTVFLLAASIHADGRKYPCIFHEASALELRLREFAPSKIPLLVVKLADQPTYFHELVPIKIPPRANSSSASLNC